MNRHAELTEDAHLTIKILTDIVKRLHPSGLKMPKLPEPYLTAAFSENCQEEIKFPINYAKTLKLSASGVVNAKIIAAEQLTENDLEIKKALKVIVEFQEKELIPFQPGDSFGFLCENLPDEVQLLLKRLGLEAFSDVVYTVITEEGTVLPPHVLSISTPREYFSTFADIRCIPKKAFLQVLAHCTEDKTERRLLELLCSSEGSSYYSKYMLESSLTVLDVLMLLPSCNPPFERLLEHLPPLKPRYYSVTSSPLESDQHFEIALSIIPVTKQRDHCVERKGICSSWLDRMTWHLTSVYESKRYLKEILPEQIKSEPCVNIYKKLNKFFHLPEDCSKPLIMVGPGVGVTPFIGFLRHRELQHNDTIEFGETWLFYGCRYKTKDFLYRNELEKLNSKGTLTHLIVCYSRDDLSAEVRYVQDNIVSCAFDLVKTIDAGAVIYVCGDAKNMKQNVRHAFSLALQKARGCSEQEAVDILKKLDKENRYLVDTWR